jgi:hypothetical protein
MPTLYTKVAPMRSNLPGINPLRMAKELIPHSTINVIDHFPWTLSKSSEIRSEIPAIILTEYYQTENRLNQLSMPYGTTWGSAFAVPFAAFNTNSNNLYEGLYDHRNPSDFVYWLPFFSKDCYSVNNSWSQVDGLDTLIQMQSQIAQLTLDSAVAVKDAFARTNDKDKNGSPDITSTLSVAKDVYLANLASQFPSIGLIDPPSLWETSEPREISFEFPLFNIDGDESTIVKNWELCYILSYQNAVNKRNFFTAIPPVYYSVYIPGVYHTKAAYIKTLSIDNVGHIRKMSLPIDGSALRDVNIPDAYSIKITLKDLLVPSKNLLVGSVNSDARDKINTSTFDTAAAAAAAAAQAAAAQSASGRAAAANASSGSSIPNFIP